MNLQQSDVASAGPEHWNASLRLAMGSSPSS